MYLIRPTRRGPETHRHEEEPSESQGRPGASTLEAVEKYLYSDPDPSHTGSVDDIVGTTPEGPEDGQGDRPGGVRAFLIADVRGYTRFTREKGDEAAAELAGRYAAIVREVAEPAGGNLLELRGDEALVVFDSPRQAVRAALGLRDRLIEETIDHPERPLPVGMGLDVGEAVSVEGGYRGGALNVAARLCSSAGPGEILASRELVHLARKVEGVSYADVGRMHLKGLDRSTAAVRVKPEREDAARLAAFMHAVRAAAPPKKTRHRTLIALGAVVAAAAIGGAAIALGSGDSPTASRPNALGSIELSGTRVSRWVDVGDKPVGVASGAGSIWVANEESSTVSRIDPVSNEVEQTIPMPGRPVVVAFEDDALWISIPENGTVLRLNPDTNTVVQTIEAGNEPIDIAAADGELWTANRLEHSVTRIDTESGAELATIAVGRSPTGIAVGDHVWVTNGADGTVSQIDRSTGHVIREIAVGSNPADVAVGRGFVWVANNLDGTVSKLDPNDGRVLATIAAGNGPREIAFGSGSVWVTNEYEGSVARIDASSDSLTEKIKVGNAPQGVVVTDGKLWFATRARRSDHRGGTFRVIGANSDLQSLDPAIAYSVESWQLLLLSYDGLVGFKKVGGADGATLVPNLATAIPRPTKNGRSYTFQLRPELHFSNGDPVVPSDVLASMERVLALNPDGQFFYSTIDGAAKCSRKDCDLSKGIVPNDAAGTVTFNLTAPDPDFLYKMAMPFASVLPASTPMQEIDEAGSPVTGPYMLDRVDPGRDNEEPNNPLFGSRLTFVRNPRFVEWSPAAQPDGYVDKIVFTPQGDLQPTLVENGEADLIAAELGFDTDVHERLAREYTQQLFTYPTQSTMGIGMNTRAEPFDDVRVRRAVNYAIDRTHLVGLHGGLEKNRLTCQILPPNVPAFEPYCPYTVNPSTEGSWTGPDTGRAKELIERADAKGTNVEVWDTGFTNGVGPYLVSVLRDIGLDAKLRFIKNQGAYFDQIHAPSSDSQIFTYGWIADYPTASNFLNVLFSCDSFANVGHLCDRKVSKALERALRLDSTNPAAAQEVWAEIDRMVSDLAPWAPFLNSRGSDFVSERVGNYLHHPQWGALLSQMWVED